MAFTLPNKILVH